VVTGLTLSWSREPQIITPSLVETLQTLTTVDPDHLPHALAAVCTVMELQPHLPAVACFDTAFHRDMPSVAKRYLLPVEGDGNVLQRYGFHGLSCGSIV
jgi:acetate kinase